MASLFSQQALAPYAHEVNVKGNEDNAVSLPPIVNKSSPLYRIGQLALLSSNGFDLGTTEKVMSQGGKELNPLMGHTPVTNALTKTGLTGIQLLLLHNLAKSHPNIAGALGLVQSIFPTVAGIHNLGQIK